MKIHVTSVLVDDQEKALQFYTTRLGFRKKLDIPMGEYRWLTLVSPEAPDGVELLLEPAAHAAAAAFRAAIRKDRIPWTSFEVADLEQEVRRLKSMGVRFIQEPMAAGDVSIATLDDSCGNYIQLMQRRG